MASWESGWSLWDGIYRFAHKRVLLIRVNSVFNCEKKCFSYMCTRLRSVCTIFHFVCTSMEMKIQNIQKLSKK